MKVILDTRRIALFLFFAFGIAWLTALIIYFTGGLVNSPELIPGSKITLALVLLALPYMWAPALAHIFTRLLTHEGWKNLKLKPNFRQAWPYWLVGWFYPGIATVIGAAIFFLLFPQYFDSGLTSLQSLIQSSPALAHIHPWLLIILQISIAMLISPVANAIATFGEEFGWRAYLLPKLLPLGWRKATIFLGVIWGVWHWPVIFMGYEYGFKYPGYPWVGPLLFIWIAFSFGTFLSWLSVRGKSVWPAVIGHAAINGIAAVGIMVTIGSPNPLVGPLPVGIIGSVGYAIVALMLFFKTLEISDARK